MPPPRRPGKRRLGSCGIEVSELSLGSWRTYERLPAQAGIAIMRAAHDAGITFFDDARYNDETGTAPIPTGYSEVVFGELFRGTGLRRDEVVVANKLWWEFWPEQDATAELDGSLRRMSFDYVDLIYASAPPPGMSPADLVGAVGGLIAAGKARAWGMLNWPADMITEAVGAAASLGIASPCAAQLPYSLSQRLPVEDPAMAAALRGVPGHRGFGGAPRPAHRGFGGAPRPAERPPGPAPHAGGIGVVASFCLAGGVLSGKYRSGAGPGGRPPGTPADEGATGRAAGTLDQPRVAPAVRAAEELSALAGRLGTTAAALALAFPLANPAVTSVLFGATSVGQLRENLAAVSVLDGLAGEDLAQLRRIGLSSAP